MKKIVLTVLIAVVAIFNFTNVTFQSKNSDLALFQLKTAQACDGEESSFEEDAWELDEVTVYGDLDEVLDPLDYTDSDGDPFPHKTPSCGSNCEEGWHPDQETTWSSFWDTNDDYYQVPVEIVTQHTDPISGDVTNTPGYAVICPEGHDDC
ncbi:hypothetical protein [uncultured Maribacter sp.]|uniref:hypothetical protein n=1 Tax=uncultured Maribacter sp. TaxID=431308 RepID=UPI002623AFFE|nr:hypothetical protein [uncultured Maribacter sp.]